MITKKREVKCSQALYDFVEEHKKYYVFSSLNFLSAVICLICMLYFIIYNHELGNKYLNIVFCLMVCNLITIYITEKYIIKLKGDIK
jgi:hypothetical protein